MNDDGDSLRVYFHVFCFVLGVRHVRAVTGDGSGIITGWVLEGDVMQWNRIRAGLYRAGAWTVGKIPVTGEWFCEGPGADCVMPTKAAAQRLCEAARQKVAGK